MCTWPLLNCLLCIPLKSYFVLCRFTKGFTSTRKIGASAIMFTYSLIAFLYDNDKGHSLLYSWILLCFDGNEKKSLLQINDPNANFIKAVDIFGAWKKYVCYRNRKYHQIANSLRIFTCHRIYLLYNEMYKV